MRSSIMQPLSKFLTWFCLGVVLLLGLWFQPASASPALVDPRLNRLESQLRSLQSQVTRLQSQLPRAGANRPVPGTPVPAADVPSFDQQFDTLAVLMIELQERVSVLEERLNEIEEPGQ